MLGGIFHILLPVEEAIFSNYGIAAIIKKKRWLNESAISSSADQFPQKLKSLVTDLVIRDGLRVQIIIIRGKATTLMSCFQQLRNIGVVPGTISTAYEVVLGDAQLHHSRYHALVVLALRDSSQSAGELDNLRSFRRSSHCE
jgi:hypothetical protein